MMQGMDPNLLLQWLQQQRGGMAQPQQPPSFGFAPPQIDQTPGPFTGAGIARANQPGPGLPPLPGAAPQQASGGPPSQASQWAASSLFGPQLGAGGSQMGLGQAGMMSLLKMFGL